jgi:hypothetical protein
LCARLADALDAWQLGGGPPEDTADSDLIAKTRAALLEPVVGPAAPSDADLEDLAEVCNDYTVQAIRRALELWGNCTTPTPIPVAERLPGEGDCDAQGRCWQEEEGTSCDPPAWTLVHRVRIIERTRGRFLPFHALPLPAAPGEAFPTPIAPIEALGPGHALPLPAAPGEGTP